MKSVTQLKSLGDMRTTISTHGRSAPRQKGSTYLEAYLLDKEKQRLEAELAMLSKRRERIEGRLGEVHKSMEHLLRQTPAEDQTTCRPLAPALAEDSPQKGNGQRPRWRTIAIEY